MRVIVNNKTELSEELILDRIISVMKLGKISRTGEIEQYCQAATFSDCTITSSVYEGIFIFSAYKSHAAT